jgi:Coenzyme PQQ synthesis protein D (PqqD)
MYPLAKATGLIIEELPSETIVYDTKRHRAHCLNQTASLIWRHCDGRTSVAQLAELLFQTLGMPADPEIVRVGLRRLSDCRLLVSESADTNTVSRRELTKRLSVLGGAFIGLAPAITSIVAPTPAMAWSGDHYGNGGGNGQGGNGQGGNGQGGNGQGGGH